MSSTEPGQLLELARTELDRLRVTRAAVGLLSDGDVRTAGFGVPRDALFRVCSVTKPLTATLVMALVEEGRLELDAPVIELLPELPLADPIARVEITLRHLLTHTSGIECELPGDLARYGAGEDALERAIADFGLLRRWLPPGRAWGYCNSGYWLAGALIERVTGSSFEDAARDCVLDPLGMRRSRFELDGERPRFPRCRNASGGLVSSVDELLRFAGFHLSVDPGPPVSIPGRRAMQRAEVVGGDHPDSMQGLGWSVISSAGGRAIAHAGSYAKWESLLLALPARGIALAVLTEGDEGAQLCQRLHAELLEHELGWRRPEPQPIELGDAELAPLAGRYEHCDYDRLTVSVREGGLVVEGSATNGVERTLYVPVSRSEFVAADGPEPRRRLTFMDEALRLGGRLGRRSAEVSAWLER